MNNTKKAILVAFATVMVFSFTINESFSQTTPQLFTSVQDKSFAFSQDGSEYQLVIFNSDALSLDDVSVTMFDQEISLVNTEIKTYETGFTWFGRTDNARAVLVVEGDEMTGIIRTLDDKFFITSVTNGNHLIEKIDSSKFIGEKQFDFTQYPSLASPPDLPADELIKMDWLAEGFDESRNYANNQITIDIFVGMTDKTITDSGKSKSRFANLVVDMMNDSLFNSDPIEFNLVDYDDVSYTETNIINDFANLMDPSYTEFDGIRALAINNDADIVILTTGYSGNEACGVYTLNDSDSLLSRTADLSYTIVNWACVANDSGTHVVGHLLGADHDRWASNWDTHPKTNDFFDYGHGHFSVNDAQRTIMSYDCQRNSEDHKDRGSEYCVRTFPDWSTPERNYFGSVTPMGTTESENNLKVLYSTAPYIASLRGGTEVYYNGPITGAISVSDSTPDQGDTIRITATFTNDIHPNNDSIPELKITDAVAFTTSYVTMLKTDSKTYYVDHTLNGYAGTVHITFNDGTGIFGEPIETEPTSGKVIVVQVPDTDKPIVNISLPNENDFYEEGTSIWFFGTAIDVVDGDLENSIQWSSLTLTGLWVLDLDFL